MFQTICLSPLGFEELFKNIPFYKRISSDLDTERLLADETGCLLNEYLEILDKFDEKGRQFAEEFISIFNNGKVDFIPENNLTKRSYKDYDKFASEKKLLCHSFWKILIIDNRPWMGQTDMNNKVDVLRVCEYPIPPEFSQLRSRATILKEIDEEFDFQAWITKYIIDANNVEIYDPFAGSEYNRKDLEGMVEKIMPRTPISIFCRESIDEKGRQLRYDEALSNLMTRKNVTVTPREIWDRKIITDKFIITLGHATGSTIHKNGKWLCKKSFDISVNIHPSHYEN